LVAAKRTAEAMSLLRAGDVRGLLSRYADLGLAALVVSIVGMMIVPLPTPAARPAHLGQHRGGGDLAAGGHLRQRRVALCFGVSTVRRASANV